jgi:hypothetical protein
MGFGQIKPHFLSIDIFWFLQNPPTFTLGIIEVAFCQPTCFNKKSSLGINNFSTFNFGINFTPHVS